MGGAEPLSVKARKHAYYELNKERIKAKVRAYQKKNRAKIRVKLRRKRAANPEFFKERIKRYYLENLADRRERSMNYHRENRERLLEDMKRRYRRNRAYRIERQKKYYLNNIEKRRAAGKAAYWKDPDEARAVRRMYRRDNIHRARKIDRERAKIRHGSPGAKELRAAYYQRTKDRHIKSAFAKSVVAKASFGNMCGLCGYDRHLDVLEFDHIKRPYKRGRSRDWRDRAMGALKRPDRFRLLCANCHAIHSILQKMAKAKNLELQRGRQDERQRLIKKFGGSCEKCGYDKNYMAFEFDHKGPIWGEGRSSAIHHVRKWPNLFNLLCANCHTLKTIRDMIRAGRRKNVHSAS